MVDREYNNARHNEGRIDTRFSCGVKPLRLSLFFMFVLWTASRVDSL